MNIAQNLEGQHSPPLKQQQFLQNQNQETSIYDQIYDDEFVSLINGLNESIKEYYKKNNLNYFDYIYSYYYFYNYLIPLLFVFFSFSFF